MIGDTGKIRDERKFRNEGDKVYAFKPQPHRFLSFFVEDKKIIVTNAFWKKQDKLPKGEKERALRCMESYNKRVKEGKYYCRPKRTNIELYLSGTWPGGWCLNKLPVSFSRFVLACLHDSIFTPFLLHPFKHIYRHHWLHLFVPKTFRGIDL